MLDAFGKGASSDIQRSKQELYAQVGTQAGGAWWVLRLVRQGHPVGLVKTAGLVDFPQWPGPGLCRQAATQLAPAPTHPLSPSPLHQMTWDQETSTSMCVPRYTYTDTQVATTPMVSPPMSPKLVEPAALPPGVGAAGRLRSGASGGLGWGGGQGSCGRWGGGVGPGWTWLEYVRCSGRGGTCYCHTTTKL